MSERTFRLVLGVSLLTFLVIGWDKAVYSYVALLLFEGATNWRIPILTSKLRYGDNFLDRLETTNECSCYSLEAERMLRLIVAGFVVMGFVLLPKLLWFFPWFVGFMFTMASQSLITRVRKGCAYGRPGKGITRR